jgi:hypothetical protein
VINDFSQKFVDDDGAYVAVAWTLPTATVGNGR